MNYKEFAPLLGQTVKFVLIDHAGNPFHGEGVVHNIFIGPDKRMMIRVHSAATPDGKPVVHNIDPPAINPTKAGIQKYIEHLKKIGSISDVANKEIRERTQRGNDDIEELNAAYMGPVYGA